MHHMTRLPMKLLHKTFTMIYRMQQEQATEDEGLELKFECVSNKWQCLELGSAILIQAQVRRYLVRKGGVLLYLYLFR